MNRIWLICAECGYNTQVLEEEVFDHETCPICQEGRLVVDINQGKQHDKKNINNPDFTPMVTGDNFPQIMGSEREMRDSFGTIGIENTWYMIEDIVDVKIRLRYRDLFFKCGGRVPEEIL